MERAGGCMGVSLLGVMRYVHVIVESITDNVMRRIRRCG